MSAAYAIGYRGILAIYCTVIYRQPNADRYPCEVTGTAVQLYIYTLGIGFYAAPDL